MQKLTKPRPKTSTHRPPLQRSNLAVARAVLRALNHQRHKHLPDRELGRRLGLDHRTIGRWRKRLMDVQGGEVPHTLLTKKQFWTICRRVSAILPDAMWRELDQQEIPGVWKAYVALHRVLHGGKTLPDRPSEPRPVVNEESCKS